MNFNTEHTASQAGKLSSALASTGRKSHFKKHATSRNIRQKLADMCFGQEAAS